MREDYKSMPSSNVIAAYWKEHCPITIPWVDMTADCCWRCGTEFAARRTLEKENDNQNKCHIVPRALGGSCNPSNLVLLCAKCHREAPDVVDPEYIWYWIECTSIECRFSDFAEAYHIYEMVFGRFPVPKVAAGFFSATGRVSLFPEEDAIQGDDLELFARRFASALTKTLPRTIAHAGYVAPATIAWAIHEAVTMTQSPEMAAELDSAQSKSWDTLIEEAVQQQLTPEDEDF